MANSSWQLCNSQNVEEIIMNLQYFWKNVNKQLKSADFLSEISKFQKIHINKVFAFFNLSSKHTLICVVQTPNSQKCNVNLLPTMQRREFSIYWLKRVKTKNTNFWLRRTSYLKNFSYLWMQLRVTSLMITFRDFESNEFIDGRKFVYI